MRASDMQDSDYWRGMIYGDAGVGKTCTAAQFPGPIEYWDFDNKIHSAIRFLKSKGQAAKLDDIDVHSFAHLPKDKAILEWHKRSQPIDKIRYAGGQVPFKTLVLDSITTFSQAVMDDYIYRSQKGLKRPLEGVNGLQDYQLYAKHMYELVAGCMTLPCHVVLLAHIEVDKDESTGTIIRKPLVFGNKFAPMLPMLCQEVYVAKALPDGKRVLQTQPKGGFIARSQRGLAPEIPMEVGAFLK